MWISKQLKRDVCKIVLSNACEWKLLLPAWSSNEHTANAVQSEIARFSLIVVHHEARYSTRQKTDFIPFGERWQSVYHQGRHFMGEALPSAKSNSDTPRGILMTRECGIGVCVGLGLGLG